MEEGPIGLREQKSTIVIVRIKPRQKERSMQIVLDPEKSQTRNLKKTKKSQYSTDHLQMQMHKMSERKINVTEKGIARNYFASRHMEQKARNLKEPASYRKLEINSERVKILVQKREETN